MRLGSIVMLPFDRRRFGESDNIQFMFAKCDVNPDLFGD